MQSADSWSRTNENLVAARFLLKPGRRYEDAVKTFEPYDHVKEENPDARIAAKVLIEEGKDDGADAQDVCVCEQQVGGECADDD